MTDYKDFLINLLGNEENVRQEWNKYVESNMETETLPKVYLNNPSSLAENVFPFVGFENIAKSVTSDGYKSNDKYVYEWEGGFRSCDSIFGVINLVGLYQYVTEQRLGKLANMIDWAKELKEDYEMANGTHSLLIFADSCANFLDVFIRNVGND